jgi:hypothetical protein
VDLSDAITVLGFLFLGDPRSLECEKSADADDSGTLDLTDVLAILNHLFLAGPAPPPPFGACGADPRRMRSGARVRRRVSEGQREKAGDGGRADGRARRTPR